MKTMKKIVCALMTLVLLLSSVPAVFADEAKTIDQDAACSLSIWKFDYTNAKKDGVWDEDAFPSTGWQESYVENALVNTNRKGDTDGQNGNALGNGQTSKGYAIAGVEFTYLKAADIVTFENQGTTQVLYGFHKTDAANLLKAIGLENGANRCAEADSLDADRYFYTHHRAARYDVDMTKGSITKHLINFALPLMVGNLFQQLYNMVDTWV